MIEFRRRWSESQHLNIRSMKFPSLGISNTGIDQARSHPVPKGCQFCETHENVARYYLIYNCRLPTSMQRL